jgi:putative DNA primase/helicase
MAEADAILAWMVEGCLLWQREGLRMPEVATTETQDYFDSEDSFGAWVRDRCVLTDLEAFTYARDLFSDWTQYAKDAGEPPGTLKRFSQGLKRRGGFIIASRRMSGAGFVGIRMRTIDESDAGREFTEQTDNVVSIRRKDC